MIPTIQPADPARAYRNALASAAPAQPQNALSSAMPMILPVLISQQEANYNALRSAGGPTRAAAQQASANYGAGSEWLRYANQGAVRSLPLSDDLIAALSFLPELGIEMEVFSGGQPDIGTSTRRVGSTRHDSGNAADVFFYKNGRKIDWSNPDDLPLFQEIVRRARSSGITGIGAGPGYMRPGSMHIGFGNEAVWGAGGRGANAPAWLRQAFYG